MNLRQHTRQNPSLRRIARRLPVIRSYERRIEELRELVETERQAAAEARAALWVPPGHFYSPFPDLHALKARKDVFGRDPTDTPGVDLALDAQWRLLDELEPLVAGVEWPRTQADAQAAGVRYWADNPAYGDGDAIFLRAMLRHFAPKRLLELGSGYSSACTLDTREQFLSGQLEITFVDPYPELLESLLRPEDRHEVTILPVGSENLEPEHISALQAGDVLFIDSTHVSKPGSDVNRNIFEILPALNPGVIIHLHDIFPAFEYPEQWVEEGRGWTELYVLRAFLQYNTAFEILLWPGVLRAVDPEQVTRRFPAMARNAGGAMWLRRVA